MTSQAMANPENPFAPREHGRLEQVTPRVHLWRNIVNSTVVVGERGVAVIDTQVNQALARRLLDAVQRAFARPVLYAINTHYHWDHTSGNAVFKQAGATLVASRRTAAAMVERAPRQKAFLSGRGFELGPDPLAPELFSDDHPRLDLGGVDLELIPGKSAETADPTLVWCEQERVLAVGDTVMTGSFPIFGQPSQREGLEDTGWLDALAQVRARGADHVCPGHGPLAHEPELALLERICRYFLEQVPRHRAAGRDLDATIRAMEEEMPAWITRIPEVWGTPRYAILRVWAGLEDLGQPGWQHLKPSAVPRVEPSARPSEPWIDAARHALEGGDAAQAVGLAEAATRELPNDPDAWALYAAAVVAASRGVASVLEKGDCFAAAKHAIDRALAIDPAHTPALLQAGQFQVMMAFRNGDDPSRGEALLDRAAGRELDRRQRAELAFYRGIAARARGDEASARARFQEAMLADPAFKPALIASMA
jgi:glyoxylase-like metal-dependent hydrolase (beta-lactamase superfamily II)